MFHSVWIPVNVLILQIIVLGFLELTVIFSYTKSEFILFCNISSCLDSYT